MVARRSFWLSAVLLICAICIEPARADLALEASSDAPEERRRLQDFKCPKRLVPDVLEPCPEVCVRSEDKELAINATEAIPLFTCMARSLDVQCACRGDKVLKVNTNRCIPRARCNGDWELVNGEIANHNFFPLDLSS